MHVKYHLAGKPQALPAVIFAEGRTMLTPNPKTVLANIIAAKRAIYLENVAGSQNPVHLYNVLVPYEYETQKLARQAFARINDWKISANGFAIEALAGHRPNTRWSGQQYNRPLFDHCLFFKRRGQPAAIAVQPYPDAIFSCIKEAQEIADWLELRLHVPPAPKASIHYPGGTAFLVFTRRNEQVVWLPEQVSGVGRAVRMYFLVGRPS